MKNMSFIFILCISGLLNEKREGKTLSDPPKIEIVFYKKDSVSNRFRFIIQVKYGYQAKATFPSNYFPRLNDGQDGNIDVDLLYVREKNDTVNLSNTIDYDGVNRNMFKPASQIIQKSDNCFNEVVLPEQWFGEKGMYLIRFVIKSQSWIPGNTDISSDWISIRN